jgi:hypothetical protein
MMKEFYTLSYLSKLGKFILVCLPLILLLSSIFIPAPASFHLNDQALSINGNSLKYDDTALIKVFLESVKKNKGVLVLGTSESTSIEGGNFYGFLNGDSTCKRKFSILAGAGRTCGIYESLLIKYPAWFEGLEVLYVANPAYWRSDLCKLNKEYWNRYSNYYTCWEASKIRPTPSLDEYSKTLSFIEKVGFVSEHFLQSCIAKINNVKYLIHPERYAAKITLLSKQNTSSNVRESFSHPDYLSNDTTLNIDKSFSHLDWLKPIEVANNFRYQELKSFINLSKQCKMKLRVLICPYNAILLSHLAPEQLPVHESWRTNVVTILMDEKVPFIDATKISFQNATFEDHQHFNSYGAYLLYKEIKSSYGTSKE